MQDKENNIHVSKNLKWLRQYRGLSQKDLGAAVGLSGSQISKFERNLCPVSAGQLYFLAKALQVPLAWFFEGLQLARHPEESARVPDISNDMALEALGLIRAYSSLPLEQKRSVQGYVHRLAERYGSHIQIMEEPRR